MSVQPLSFQARHSACDDKSGGWQPSEINLQEYWSDEYAYALKCALRSKGNPVVRSRVAKDTA